MTKKYRFIFLISGFILFGCTYLLLKRDSNFLFFDTQEVNKYIEVDSSVSFRGKIISLHKNRGAVYLTLDNGEKYVTVDNINSSYSRKNLTLFRVVTLGDSIWKNPGIDTIFIFTKEKKLMYPLFSN